MPIFLKFCHKLEREGILPNSFYGAIVTLITKPYNGPTKKQNYRSISLISRDAKILNTV